MVKDEYRRDLPPKSLLLPFSLFTLHMCVRGVGGIKYNYSPALRFQKVGRQSYGLPLLTHCSLLSYRYIMDLY